MDAQAHIDFIKRMIVQLQSQVSELEAEQKAQFDAAQIPLPIADEGWIEWNGGECPVSGGVRVDVRFGDGQECKRICADNWEWGSRASEALQIIAYRIAGERA